MPPELLRHRRAGTSTGLLLYSYVLNAVESFFFLFVFQLNPSVNFYVTEVGQSETFSPAYYSPSLWKLYEAVMYGRALRHNLRLTFSSLLVRPSVLALLL